MGNYDSTLNPQPTGNSQPTQSTPNPRPKSPKFAPDILAAGFSAVLGVEVVIDEPKDSGSDSLPILTVDDVFNVTYTQVPREEVTSGDTFPVFAKTLTGSTIVLQTADYYTIATVKAEIESQEGIPAKKIRLNFKGKKLEDEQDVKSAGISSGSTIFLMLNLRGSGKPKLVLSEQDFAFEFNYDFTCLQDDGTKYYRGGYEYQRPYGWYRFAVNVQGNSKYGGDDSWLGPRGVRTNSAKGEWPISYHGSDEGFGKIMPEEGEGKHVHSSRGVYSTPSLDTAADYAIQFDHLGHRYKIIFQNRINPESGHFHIMEASKASCSKIPQADYWISPQEDPAKHVYDIRPYGVLICQVK